MPALHRSGHSAWAVAFTQETPPADHWAVASSDRNQRSRANWAVFAATGICLFLGFWAFVYQGFTEDAGLRPIQSWPFGAALYAIAGALIVTLIRRARPELDRHSLVLISCAVFVLLVFAALGSLDAGGHSFEF